MTSIGKGAILGGAAMVAITVIWMAATGTAEGDCINPGPGWNDGCQCNPVPGDAILLCGLVLGVPWGVVFGCAIGGLAPRITRHRKLVLAVLAPAIALVLAAITTPFMHCSTDPRGFALWSRAFVPLAIAALVLEAWTRPRSPLPVAISQR